MSYCAVLSIVMYRFDHSFFESLQNHATWDERLHQTTIDLGFKSSQVVNYEYVSVTA